MNRRRFMLSSTMAAAGIALSSRLDAMAWKTTLHKALIGSPTEEVLRNLKAAGFDGIETTNWNVSADSATDSRKLADSLGMKIHSILFGWGTLNGDDSAIAKTIREMEIALKAAQGYGCDAVLFVPCRIDGHKMPDAWEFDVRIDEKTGHLKQVVSGDNSAYQAYIDAHNHATDKTREGVQRLIPAAEKAGIVIALENVWNNLWVKPELAKNLVESFNSPWVRAYFDIGNHVKFAPPQEWIRTLGNLIVKCHVKDFKLGPDGHGGGMEGFKNIREGSVDWPAVRKALDDIGYNGWMTIEGDTATVAEQSKRLDLIIAGE